MISCIKKGRLITGFLCIALSSVLAGCLDKDGATGPVIYIVDGSWSGTTSQGQAISFTVASNAVTHLKIKILAGGGGSVESQVWPNNCPVSNNAFSLTNPGTPTLTVKGTFTGNMTANGTFEYGATSGTWSAKR
jgi:hypothetical protein